MISDLVAVSGVDLEDIVAGANRYRLYTEATSGKKRQSAKAWLARQGWRDSWELPPKKQKERNTAGLNPKKVMARLRSMIGPNMTITDEAAFMALYNEVFAFVDQHIWPDGLDENAEKFDREIGNTAACQPCWFRFFDDGKHQACTAQMDELGLVVDLIDKIEMAKGERLVDEDVE